MRCSLKTLPALTLLVTLAPAADEPSFDVASIKPNKSSNPPASNFPLGPGDVFNSTGGFFSASNLPLITYLFFAYKIMGDQAQYVLRQLPGWASNDRFDIQARAAGNPGKDQMRLMMRSLLAERCKLALHHENREIPVLALVLVKPGKTGPHLQLHPSDETCSTASVQVVATIKGGFPATCNGLYPLTATDASYQRVGARNVSMKFIADSVGMMADLGRPLVDQTGITGTVDFVLEWVPDRSVSAQPGAEPRSELPSGPTFQQALRDQLGIKLESQKAPVDVLIVDHVERPTEN